MNATGTEARVCQDIADRQAKGIAKYGTTVEGNPLGLLQWYKHHYEELLDAAVYVKRIIELMEGVQSPLTPEGRLMQADFLAWCAQGKEAAQSTTLEDGSVLTASCDAHIRDVKQKLNEPADPHNEQTAAVATLKNMGYEWRGGVLWVPPIGKAPDYITDPHAELRQTWKPGQVWQWRTRNFKNWLDCEGPPLWEEALQYRRHPDDKDAEDASKPVNHPWTPWHGMDTPPADCDVFVQVQFRDCDRANDRVGSFAWNHTGGTSDIVAYRVVK